MLFSSIPFLYYFIVITLILYIISPKKLKNATLLLTSLFFYFWGERMYTIIMVVSILFGYVFGLLIERFRDTKAKKPLTAVSVALSLSFLLYFKYADFFIENFNAVTGLSVPLLNVVLPIGISFYTFQIISYTIDVSRGERAQKNPVSLGAYITMFPQLIAGPIVRYSDIDAELRSRTHSVADTAEGIRRFIFGLAKKILIANQLGELVSLYRASDEKSVLFHWLYAAAFCLHIYFDFSGYSDMAIGLGRIFGFHFIENFNYPYISASITEFWRRWHISLGSWFRDYVYIPLGGNRCSRARQLFNILVVWFLTGMWHGAAWNFIVWGLYFAVLLTIEKLWLLPHLKRSKVISRVYVLILVLISFVIFNASSMAEAGADLAGLIGVGDSGMIPLVSPEAVYNLKSFAVVIVIAIIGATPLPKKLAEKFAKGEKTNGISNICEPVVLMALLLVMTAYLVDGSFNPFLYFRF